MATFTFGRSVDIHWQGYEVVGPAGTVFSIPDQLYDEFNDDIAPVEPTLTWVDTNEFLTLSNSVSVTTLTGTIPISVTSTTSGKVISINSTTNPAGYTIVADGTGGVIFQAGSTGALTSVVGISPISAIVSGNAVSVSLNANYQTAGSYQPSGTYVTGVVGTSPISATGTTAITVSLNANYQTAGTYVNAVIGTSPASVSTASGTSTVSIVAGSIDSTHLSATSVGSSQLINGSVTSDKLGAASVVAAKIDTGAVGSAALAANAVVAAKISSGSVGTVAISSGSATSGQILQANGSGGVAFATPAASGGFYIDIAGALAGTALGLTSQAYAVTNVGAQTEITISSASSTFTANTTKRITSTANLDSIGSSGGVTWTSRTYGGTDIILGVTYGNALYVAGDSGGVIRTSPDGTTWTSRTANMGGNPIRAIAYGNGLYFAVGNLY